MFKEANELPRPRFPSISLRVGAGNNKASAKRFIMPTPTPPDVSLPLNGITLHYFMDNGGENLAATIG